MNLGNFAWNGNSSVPAPSTAPTTNVFGSSSFSLTPMVDALIGNGNVDVLEDHVYIGEDGTVKLGWLLTTTNIDVLKQIREGINCRIYDLENHHL